MAEREYDPDDGMLVGQITILRTLQPDGFDLVTVEYTDANGDDLPVIEALGMLELARDTILQPPSVTHPRDDEDDEDEEDDD